MINESTEWKWKWNFVVFLLLRTVAHKPNNIAYDITLKKLFYKW